MAGSNITRAFVLLAAIAVLSCQPAWSRETGPQLRSARYRPQAAQQPTPSLQPPPAIQQPPTNLSPRPPATDRSGAEAEDSAASPDSERTRRALPPPPPPPPLPPPSSSTTLAMLDRAPSMFGDLFFGSVGMSRFTAPSLVIHQTWSDIFVSNAQGDGADFNPGTPIFITMSPSGDLIAQSIGSGVDVSGDNQPDVYDITEPNGSSPGNGFIYLGGQATFGDPPQDGSVGQGNGWQLVFSHLLDTQGELMVNLPAGGGAGVRRIKLAENNSPQPRDRIFFSYNFYNDVLGGFGDVNGYTFGLEKTFHGGNCSLEMRLPLANTLAGDQMATRRAAKGNELGDLTTSFKTIIAQSDRCLMSAGLGVGIPLSDDARVFLPDGRQILRWNSESVRLLPYFALLSTPNAKWFWQAFWQLDIDLNGSSVDGNLAGGPLQRLGRLDDPTLMFVDLGAGRRLYDNPQGSIIQDVSAVAELHYSATLEKAGEIRHGDFYVRGFANHLNILNATLGLAVRTAGNIAIRPAMALPLSTDNNRAFDYEAMVQIDVYR